MPTLTFLAGLFWTWMGAMFLVPSALIEMMTRFRWQDRGFRFGDRLILSLGLMALGLTVCFDGFGIQPEVANLILLISPLVVAVQLFVVFVRSRRKRTSSPAQQTMPDSAQQRKPKRRWFRYSLHSMFVVLTIGCLLLGLGDLVHRAERQRAAVKWVKQRGGRVQYNFGEIHRRKSKHQRFGPAWVQAFVVDKDYLATVVDVDLAGREVDDVTPLAQLDRLEALDLGFTKVNELSPLAKLTRLRYLNLSYTRISQEQVDELQSALPNCEIVR